MRGEVEVEVEVVVATRVRCAPEGGGSIANATI